MPMRPSDDGELARRMVDAPLPNPKTYIWEPYGDIVELPTEPMTLLEDYLAAERAVGGGES